MKVNVELLRLLRKDRSWSQEELAIAAGLNLRTIQRIEKEASASLQSKKALASAFKIDVRDLDYEENTMLQDMVGKNVQLHLGSWGDDVKGKVLTVTDTWLKIQVKNVIEIINLNAVSRITILK